MKIECRSEILPAESQVIREGFAQHTLATDAPPFTKTSLNWLAFEETSLIGAATAEVLWDWLYVDKLWVDTAYRENGVGSALMLEIQEYVISSVLTGVWLWTQSWQAAEFYEKLGYERFTEFNDFPKGFKRFGYRKYRVEVGHLSNLPVQQGVEGARSRGGKE